MVAYATSLGLSPGFALDLAVNDPDNGMPWDFHVPAKCEKAVAKVREEKPKLLIGSSLCTPFSLLQNLLKNKGNIEEKKRLLARGIKHVKFCIQLCREQISKGRYFLHEHPNAGTSLQIPEMVQLLMHPDVTRTEGDMRAHSMKSQDAKGEGLAKQQAGWATNAPYVAEQVSAQCSNKWKGAQDRHVHLILAELELPRFIHQPYAQQSSKDFGANLSPTG